MVPTAYRTIVGASLLMLGSAGCRNGQPEDTRPPDPLVVPQSPDNAAPLHMSEDEDYEEYEKRAEDDRSLEPPPMPEEEVMEPLPGDEPD